MRPPFRALLCAAPLLAGCGGSLFFVEAELEELCTTERDIAFPAAPAGTSTLQHSFQLPLGETGGSLPEGRMDSSLQLLVFEVTATAGNPDLRGIELATVAVRAPGSTSPPIKLLDYQRPANPPTTSLTLGGSEPVDVLELARQSKLELSFEARGALPQQSWTASIRVCAGVRAKVDYFDVVF